MNGVWSTSRSLSGCAAQKRLPRMSMWPSTSLSPMTGRPIWRSSTSMSRDNWSSSAFCSFQDVHHLISLTPGKYSCFNFDAVLSWHVLSCDSSVIACIQVLPFSCCVISNILSIYLSILLWAHPLRSLYILWCVGYQSCMHFRFHDSDSFPICINMTYSAILGRAWILIVSILRTPSNTQIGMKEILSQWYYWHSDASFKVECLKNTHWIVSNIRMWVVHYCP